MKPELRATADCNSADSVVTRRREFLCTSFGQSENNMRILPLIPFVFAALIGCQRANEPERVLVEGKVSYLGRPVVDGQIRFIPNQGTKGPVSGAAIRDGAYSVDLRGGVPVGTYRVAIEARRPLPNAPSDPLAGGTVSTQQYLPVIYNAQSELTITIKPGNQSITQDYELQ